MGIEWDFEGNVTFLAPEEGGLARLPRMGYFPSFRYPEFEDGMQFVARPVEGYRADGTPYNDAEPLDSTFVVFRFRFLDRTLYKRVHRGRLVPRHRFELTEGFRPVARGEVYRKREDLDPIEAEIERLVADLGEALPRADAKEVLSFLYHGEWECAVHGLWYSLGVANAVLGQGEYARLVDVGRRCDFDLERAERDCPLHVREG